MRLTTTATTKTAATAAFTYTFGAATFFDHFHDSQAPTSIRLINEVVAAAAHVSGVYFYVANVCVCVCCAHIYDMPTIYRYCQFLLILCSHMHTHIFCVCAFE